MIQIGDKEYRNLQEQVGKNKDDIEAIKQSLGAALPAPIPGPDGPQGVSVTSVTINDDNDLIVTFSNGTTQNAGHINTLRGERGLQGIQGPVGKQIQDITEIDTTDYSGTISPDITKKTWETLTTSAKVKFGDVIKEIEFKLKYALNKANYSEADGNTVILRNSSGYARVITPLDNEDFYIANQLYVGYKAHRPNLLINSNFAINQRGQAQYSGVEYSVDRWKIGSNNGVVSVGSSWITFESTNGESILYQRLEAIDLRGKPVALSIKTSEDDIRSAYQYNINDTTDEQCVIDRSPLYVAYVKQDGVGSGVFDVCIKTAYSIDLEWIKLETADSDGYVLPTPYCPPIISEELLKCQRYFIRYYISSTQNGLFSGYVFNNNKCYISIDTPVPMRTLPIWSPYSTSTFGNVVYQGYITSVTNGTCSGISNNKITLSLTTLSNSLPMNAPCCLIQAAFDLNAEIDP